MTRRKTSLAHSGGRVRKGLIRGEPEVNLLGEECVGVAMVTLAGLVGFGGGVFDAFGALLRAIEHPYSVEGHRITQGDVLIFLGKLDQLALDGSEVGKREFDRACRGK